MSDNWYSNLDSREKANALNALGRAQSLVADYVNITGDTMTGLLAGTTLAMTGNASLATADIPTITGAAISGSTIVMSGNASLATGNIPTLQGAAAGSNPLTIQRTVPGSISVAVLRISGNSTASQAVLGFYEKGFLSITSTVLTTVANTDYAIVVQVGTETRYLPLYKAAAIIGAAAY